MNHQPNELQSLFVAVRASDQARGEFRRRQNAFRETIAATTPKARQGVLFSGLDCLPGQQDLFDVDGQ